MTNATLTSMTIECPRCCGRGYMSEHAHIAGGRCFLCGGEKTIELSDAFNLEKRDVKLALTVTKDPEGRAERAQVMAYKSAGMIEGSEFEGRYSVWCREVELSTARTLWKQWQGSPVRLEVDQRCGKFGTKLQRTTYQG